MASQLFWYHTEGDWLAVVGRQQLESSQWLVDHDGRAFEVSAGQLKYRNDSLALEDGGSNLAQQPHLNEPDLLYILQKGYSSDQIYYDCGHILLAINPCRVLAGMYDSQRINQYQDSQEEGCCESRPKAHLFKLAYQAYQDLKKYHRNQTILISGESGAGKTESTKYILKYLTCASQQNELSQLILHSNPLLEAFGNASTICNHNSSRFGKFIQLGFRPNGQMSSGRIKIYLLEKIRLTTRSSSENNFHIFYQLLTWLLSRNQLEDYYLDPSGTYQYLDCSLSLRQAILNQPSSISRNWRQTVKSMRHFIPDIQQQKDIWKILIAILHIGNLRPNSPLSQYLPIKKLLDSPLSLEDLSQVFTSKKIKVGNEEYQSLLTGEEWRKTRDGFAMRLYQVLFIYIVDRINQTLSDLESRREQGEDNWIGLLDIFGFENLKDNAMEQLCINYTNERLQNLFHHYVFTQEQQEYLSEGIEWNQVDFDQSQNKECLQLFDQKLGLWELLDETCRMPAESHLDRDEKYTQNLITRFEMSNCFYHQAHRKKEFQLRHYAGMIAYSTQDINHKNQDCLSAEMEATIGDHDLWRDKPELWAISEKLTRVGGKSLTFRFRQQLAQLIEMIQETQTHYVRCIKPNDQLAPDNFDRKRVLQQLRYNGLLDAIRIARQGFPVRYPFATFSQQYNCLGIGTTALSISDAVAREKTVEQIRKVISARCSEFELPEVQLELVLGKSKVFLKHNTFKLLEELLLCSLTKQATRIQSWIRCRYWHQRWKQLGWLVLKLQCLYRRLRAVKQLELLRSCQAAIIIQRNLRSYYTRYCYHQLRRAIMVIQARTRYLSLQRRLKQRMAATIIQTFVRCQSSRKLYRSQWDSIIILQTCVRKWLKDMEKREYRLKYQLQQQLKQNKKLEDICHNLRQRHDIYQKHLNQSSLDKIELATRVDQLQEENQRLCEAIRRQALSYKARMIWNHITAWI